MEIQNNKTELQQIKELLRLWLGHWHYFLVSMAVCGTLGVVYLKTATPIMSVLAKVSLRHDESLVGAASVGNAQSLMSAIGLKGGSENIEDEALKMASQGYVKKAVRNLDLNKIYIQKEYLGLIKTNLYDRSPVILSVDTAIADTITKNIVFTMNIKPERTTIKVKAGKEKIGKYEITAYPATLKTSWGDFTLEKSAYSDLYELPISLEITYTSYDYIAQVYREGLMIDFEKKTSDLINLEFDDANVPFAQKVLNEIVNVYNKEFTDDKDAVSEKTLDFIDNRLIQTRELLADADKNIQQFKDKYSLTEIEADVTYYLTLSGELQAQLLQAETQLSVINIIVDFVSDEKNKYALIPYSLSVSDVGMSAVLSKYNEELVKRNELHKSKIQSALSNSLDEQIEVQRKNLLVTLENTKKGAQIALANLKKKEKEFSSKIGKVPTIEKDYVQLRREQEIQQTVFIFLLQMREETGVKGISLLPKLKVIDPPYAVNKPVSPNKIKTAITILFFGGFLFPVSAIYGMPYVRNFIRKRKEK